MARLVVLVLVTALGAAGCSGEDDVTAGPGTPTASGPSAAATGTGTPTPFAGTPAPSAGAPATEAAPGSSAEPSAAPAPSSDGDDPAGPAGVSSAPPSAPPATRPAGEPTAAVSTLPPVAADEDAELSDGLVVAVTDVRRQQVTATEPGDISGAAAVVSVRARNDADEPVDLSQLVVTATLDGAPAAPTQGGPADALGGELAPGASSEGSYVFRLGGSSTRGLRLQISSGGSSTVVVVQT